jgi:lysophospholipid acyltransferase (LPLAT)-like uncharacterized protein
MKKLVKHPAAQALLAALLGRYLAFALKTTRWTVHGTEHVAPHVAGKPVIVAFWHERLPLMPMLWDHARRHGSTARTHVLVSRHRDGRFIGAVVRRFALDILYGSTLRDGRDRGGASVARSMLGLLASGDHVAITPDGPRGPRRVAAQGVAELAAMSGVRVLPCSGQTTRRKTLRSWDRMVVPLPFGRGVIVCGPAIDVARDSGMAMLPAIAAALTAAADEADRLCA